MPNERQQTSPKLRHANSSGSESYTARLIAKIAARMAAGRMGHAVTSSAKSWSAGAGGLTWSASGGYADSQAGVQAAESSEVSAEAVCVRSLVGDVANVRRHLVGRLSAYG